MACVAPCMAYNKGSIAVYYQGCRDLNTTKLLGYKGKHLGYNDYKFILNTLWCGVWRMLCMAYIKGGVGCIIKGAGV